MDYNKVEQLVLLSKENNERAKEELVKEFTPLIKKLSYKNHIFGYEAIDLESECYQTLFKCVLYYNLNSHRFVAYATNALKNTVYYLIRKTCDKFKQEAIEYVSDPEIIDSTKHVNIQGSEESIYSDDDIEIIKKAVSMLSEKDKDILLFVVANKNTLKDYAAKNNISYSTALLRKKYALNRLKKSYLNIC